TSWWCRRRCAGGCPCAHRTWHSAQRNERWPEILRPTQRRVCTHRPRTAHCHRALSSLDGIYSTTTVGRADMVGDAGENSAPKIRAKALCHVVEAGCRGRQPYGLSDLEHALVITD